LDEVAAWTRARTERSSRKPRGVPPTLVQVAMREAADRLAHEDAARLGQRARELLEPHVGLIELATLLVEIAEALVRAGDLSRARSIAARAAAIAHEAGHASLLARAAIAHAEELAFPFDAPAIDWLRRALEHLHDEDAPIRALAMARLATALTNSLPDAAARHRLREDAVRMARRIGDPGTNRSFSCVVLETEAAARKLAELVRHQSAEHNEVGVVMESMVVAEVWADARRTPQEADACPGSVRSRRRWVDLTLMPVARADVERGVRSGYVARRSRGRPRRWRTSIARNVEDGSRSR
jgi:hypothetical protein